MSPEQSFEEFFTVAVRLALDKPSVQQMAKEYLLSMQQMVDKGYSVQQAANSIKGQSLVGDQVAASMVLLKKAFDNTKKSSDDMGKSVETSGNKIEKSGKQVNKTTKEYTGLGGVINKWASGFGNVGAIAEGVFGGVIGVTAVQAVQKLISYMGEAVDMAAKFERSLLTLELGVRAMQRQGIDITTKEVFESISKIQEKYKIFTEQDIIKGTNIFINNLREMGVTTEQVYQIMEIAAKASTLTGKSFEETARILNQAAVAGYSRTLNVQELGIPFSAKLAQQEAIRLGYTEKTFAQLDAQTRTLIVISLLNREIADYDKDILKIQETSSGQLQSQQAQLEQVKKDLGEGILPAWVFILEILKRIVVMVTDFVLEIVDAVAVLFQFLYMLGQLASGDVIGAAKEWELIAKRIDGFTQRFLKGWATILGLSEETQRKLGIRTELTPQLGDVTEGEKSSTSTAVEDAASEVTDVTQSMEDERLKIEQSYADDSLKIEQDRANKIEDANIDLARKLEDIDRDLARTKDDLATKLDNDLTKIDQDAAQDRIDAVNKFNQKELEAARDLQDKLRELRDKAVFDLEESVRLGDFRQARQILRQYRFDKDQAIKAADKAKQDRLIAFQQEMADIAAQRIKKRAERIQEYNEQLADAELNAARQRQDANRAYQQKLKDIELWNKREIEANRKKYEQELADLRAKLNAELAMEQQAAAEKAQIHAAEAHVGVPPNSGQTAQQIAASTGYTRGLNATTNPRDINFSGVPGYNRPGQSPTPSSNTIGDIVSNILQNLFGGGFARGGTMVATRPTIALFGEGGRERATFTPLGAGGDRAGKLALEILLSPDLIANVKEDTLSELGSIISSVERSR